MATVRVGHKAECVCVCVVMVIIRPDAKWSGSAHRALGGDWLVHINKRDLIG